MNINDIKTILYRCIFFMVFVFCLISCNNSNKNPKVIIDSDKTLETTITQETTDDLCIVREPYKPYKAVINSDCEYYHYDYNNPAGKLKQGQSILILEQYQQYGFDITVEVEIEDTGEKAFVNEKYITYDDELYTAWFKNVLLTREYYRTESAEFINANSVYNLDEDNDVWSRKDILRMWRYYFSEERLHITKKYLVIGNDETIFSYRLESVNKDGNKYTLLLSDTKKVEYKITLLDNGNNIVMTQCVVKPKYREKDLILYSLILYSLNYNYVPYNEEKADKTKSKVITWCDEQIKKLEK